MARSSIVTTISFDPGVWRRLNEICANTGIKRATLVNRLLGEAMDARLVMFQAMQNEVFSSQLQKVFARPEMMNAVAQMVGDEPLKDGEAAKLDKGMEAAFRTVVKSKSIGKAGDRRRSVSARKPKSSPKSKGKES